MSMCHIGYRAEGRTGVSYLHYAQGTLDWARYHAQGEVGSRRSATEFDEGSTNRTYFEERTAFHAEAKLAFSPALNLGGCEREAGEHGFWRCDTPQAEAVWRKHAQSCDESDEVPLDRCALVLDFDARHATIRDRQFAEWERFLPDGWTHEFAETPGDGPHAS